jgi:type I restriction enzyme S subunit
VQPEADPDKRYVGLEHIDSGNARLTRWGRASEVSSSKAAFSVGDVLYGKLRPYLEKAALAEFDGICSTDILVVTPGPRIESQFLAHLTHTSSFVQHAINTTRGVNHPRTSWSSLAEFSFALPPWPEQQAITHALHAAREAIEVRRRETSLEREHKSALMQHLFTHGTRGEPTRQTEIGEMPEGWGVVELAEVLEFLQYGTSKQCIAAGSGIPVLRIPNVIGGKIDTSDLKFIQLDNQEAAGLKLEEGDLLFVRTNGRREYVGRCAVFHRELDQALFASYLIRARFKPETLLPDFVQAYCSTTQGRAIISSRATNAADGKFNINTQGIRGILAPVPPVAEQSIIVETLHACDDKLAALEAEQTLLDELFRALLEELMTGRPSAIPLIDG